MRLTGTRLFIIPTIQEMDGRFHLHRMSRQMPDRGLVVAIAPKAQKILEVVGIGHTVIFNKHHQEISEDGKRTIISAEHVLAIIE